MAHFPFFGLPRELRDRVYEHVGGQDASFAYRPPSAVDDPSMAGLKFDITSSPFATVLLVCRDMKFEYETEIRRHATLRVTLTYNITTQEPLVLGSKAHLAIASIRKLEVRLWLTSSSLDIGHYDEVLRFISRFMLKLKEVTFDWLQLLPKTETYGGESVRQQADRRLEERTFQHPSNGNTILLVNRLFMSSFQVELSPTYQLNAQEQEKYPMIALMGWDILQSLAQTDKSNGGVLRATPSDEEGSYLGLDLEVVSCRPFHLDQAMENVENFIARRMIAARAARIQD